MIYHVCKIVAHLVLQLSLLPIWEEHEASWSWFLLYSGIFTLPENSWSFFVVLKRSYPNFKFYQKGIVFRIDDFHIQLF
jgi:hypothetical protein